MTLLYNEGKLQCLLDKHIPVSRRRKQIGGEKRQKVNMVDTNEKLNEFLFPPRVVLKFCFDESQSI